jgi:hypothetical protein
MTFSLRAFRMMAAVLAAVGLLARPLRAVVLCPMEQPVAAAATAEADEHAHHAGHDMDASASADASAESAAQLPEGGVPSHETCPDLAHCAVAAPPSSAASHGAHVCICSARAVTVHDRPASAVSTVEPPPPKQR